MVLRIVNECSGIAGANIVVPHMVLVDPGRGTTMRARDKQDLATPVLTAP